MAGHSDNVLPLPSFDEAPRILIVIAPYYGDISTAQLASARAVIESAGAAHETVEVPGSLEIAPAIAIAHRQSDYDGYVALGCVIRGRTSHYDVVVNESARGITTLGLAGACIGNGIITVENREQAEERADPERLDTAGGAAAAALHLVHLQRTLRKESKGIGFKPGSFQHDAARKGPTVA
ncbi:6,7-dimethyl-8-ribityllumazine synthase [Jannaschia sp. W003]|uniref:6,7-dimethyl-8-ribityllumazine synthase n=1 Tax=Jannaschia sp. W003 TaxID=2867012 RepID=UPI0021A93C7A|nr:6,7-dimethyl-8-ribityllumazine synthase [Jannaschia sp. W003]UWQ20066.1 6,7-dimethyl-8-ribityllumazine synthase [Jannaschia sp. W003]